VKASSHPPTQSILRLQRIFRPLLLPFGAMWRAAMEVRHRLYLAGALPSHATQAPCLSVGNISWGGTGKTPVCSHILTWAARRGLSPALVSRGYGAHPPRLPFVVEPDSQAALAGDEPLLLARMTDKAKVVVDPDRGRAAETAERRFLAGLIVMDDGFQHLALKRDIDLVLLTPEDLDRDWGRVFPAGSWREGAGALTRAHAFLVKADPQEFEYLKPRITDRLSGFGRPVFSFSLASRRVASLKSGRMAKDFGGGPYVLMTAVADPGGVEASARALLGYEPRERFFFPDHHPFSATDLREVVKAAEALDKAAILVTPKDSVKIERMAVDNVWSLVPELALGPCLWSEDSFDDWLENALAKVPAEREAATRTSEE
jgi:tetraacyldisaccharide 4'-kinase